MGIEPLDWGAKALISELFGRVANLMVAKHFGTDLVSSSSTGGHEGSRTLGLCNANAALSQLSYAPVEYYIIIF